MGARLAELLEPDRDPHDGRRRVGVLRDRRQRRLLPVEQGGALLLGGVEQRPPLGGERGGEGRRPHSVQRAHLSGLGLGPGSRLGLGLGLGSGSGLGLRLGLGLGLG